MTTDSERREVARRLRENAEAHPNMSLILNLAFADDSLKPDGSMEWRVTPHDAAMRLADLIEPTKPVDFDGFAVDRDALLALADEMQGYADGAASGDGFPYVNAGALWSYAVEKGDIWGWSSRIREALGDCQRGVSGVGCRGASRGPSGQVAGVARAAPREGAGEKE